MPGGSVGSALAILLFYPLERARVELQTNADGAATSAGHANSGPDGGTDDGIPSTLPGPSSRATVAEGGEPLEFRARDEDLSNCARAGSRMMEVMHDEHMPRPTRPPDPSSSCHRSRPRTRHPWEHCPATEGDMIMTKSPVEVQSNMHGNMNRPTSIQRRT